MLWLVRIGLLAGSDVARGDAGAETHSSASSSSLGDVSRGPAGSLAPTWLLQLSVLCTPWLGTYRHRLLSLHLILLLVPDAASYLSENETWSLPLCACRVLWIKIAAGEKAAARLVVKPAKAHQTSLLPCSPNLSVWLGHLFPTCGCCSCLLPWLPLPSQGKCILLSPFLPLVCMLICQLCQIQKRIFDCSNVLMRAGCSVIPLSNTSCVLIT